MSESGWLMNISDDVAKGAAALDRLATAVEGARSPEADERAAEAAAAVLFERILDLLQNDPHQWNSRPCPTCRVISTLARRPFGCDKFRLAASARRAT